MYISSSFFYRSQIWFANPTAVSVYIGTERSGVMRQFPYAHQGTGLAKTRYKASALPPFSTAGERPPKLKWKVGVVKTGKNISVEQRCRCKSNTT